MPHAWFWVGLFLLGCYHGVNPGMGWLFAVALGLQEKSGRAVLLALPPIAVGHIASILAIVAGAALIQASLSGALLKYTAATLLLGFGVYRAVRAGHPRSVGMRVGFSGLVLWSFLMATGHGAGLMLLPFLTHSGSGGMAGMAMRSPAQAAGPLPFGLWLLAVAVHTFGYLIVMTAVAFLIYRHVGIHIIRNAWINFDLVWAAALVVTGLIMLVL